MGVIGWFIVVALLGVIAGWIARWYWVDKRKQKA
jgi:uncharacterized membrane protein YeaQ/YmgE (transglycosylase-associated protein family)